MNWGCDGVHCGCKCPILPLSHWRQEKQGKHVFDARREQTDGADRMPQTADSPETFGVCVDRSSTYRSANSERDDRKGEDVCGCIDSPGHRARLPKLWLSATVAEAEICSHICCQCLPSKYKSAVFLTACNKCWRHSSWYMCIWEIMWNNGAALPALAEEFIWKGINGYFYFYYNTRQY